jgi:hypothetical protein
MNRAPGSKSACIYAHRPIGFPMDLDSGRRKRICELARELTSNLAQVCCTFQKRTMSYCIRRRRKYCTCGLLIR